MDNVIRDCYSKEIAEFVEDCTKTIRREMSSIQRSFEVIALNLYRVYKYDGYKTYGYRNIADYALKEFGIEKTTCYDFINIAERFGKQEEKGGISGLDDKWKAYGTSKLALIADLSDEEIEVLDITPDMPVREIKKAVSRLDKPEKPKDNDSFPTEAEVRAFYETQCESYVESGWYSRQTLKDDLKKTGRGYNAFSGGDGILKSYSLSPRGVSINGKEEITWGKFVKLIDRYIPVDDPDDPDPDNEPETADEPETTTEPEAITGPETEYIQKTVLTISPGDEEPFYGIPESPDQVIHTEELKKLLGTKFMKYIFKYLDDGFEIVDITAYKHD